MTPDGASVIAGAVSYAIAGYLTVQRTIPATAYIRRNSTNPASLVQYETEKQQPDSGYGADRDQLKLSQQEFQSPPVQVVALVLLGCILCTSGTPLYEAVRLSRQACWSLTPGFS